MEVSRKRREGEREKENGRREFHGDSRRMARRFAEEGEWEKDISLRCAEEGEREKGISRRFAEEGEIEVFARRRRKGRRFIHRGREEF